jgi:hypothetical protein
MNFKLNFKSSWPLLADGSAGDSESNPTVTSESNPSRGIVEIYQLSPRAQLPAQHPWHWPVTVISGPGRGGPDSDRDSGLSDRARPGPGPAAVTVLLMEGRGGHC